MSTQHSPIFIGTVIAAGLVCLVVLFLISQFFSLWIQALLSGAPVSYSALIRMRLRKVDERLIVYSRIRAVKAGLDIPVDPLIAHHAAGGRVPSVVNALIKAARQRTPLDWDQACAMDLAGIDPFEAVDLLGAAQYAGIELDLEALSRIMADGAAREAFLDRVRAAKPTPE